MSEFPYVSGYKQSWRDTAVAAVVNWIVNTFATRSYQAFVTDLMHLGREEFQRRLTAEQTKHDEEFLEGSNGDD